MNSKALLKKICDNPKTVLLIFVSLYLFLELLNIKLPGLYDDEAFPACGSLQIIKKIGPFMPSIKIFNTYFPLMLVSRESAMESYVLLPFLSLFGINVVILRLVPILAGAIGLILLYYFVRRFFDSKTALLSLVLLVVNPVFLLENKLGLNSASMLHPAMMTVLLCFYIWYQKRKINYFILGMFFLGIGLSIRVWYAWFITALLIFALIYFRRIWQLLGRNKAIYLLTGITVFLLGAVLFVVYNLTSKFSTFHFVVNSLVNTDNKHYYIDNLLHRLRVFSSSISGRWSLEEQGSWFHRSWSYPEPFAKIPVNNMLMWIFYASFIWLILSFLLKKSFFSKKRVLFLCGLTLIIMLLSPLISFQLAGPHLFILYPLVMIIIALALMDLAKRNKYLRFFSICMVLLITALNIKIFFNWQRYFEHTGGIGNNSDAIYALADWLKERRIKEPVVCDWGMDHNLVFLGAGVIEPKTIYDFVKVFPYGSGDDDVHFIENCRKYFIDSSCRYIFHTPAFTNMNRFNTFTRIAREMNKDVSEEKIFYQRDGKPVLVVYSVK